MMGFFRSAYVIGRRDFVATVYSKTFLLFLLGPLLVLGVSVLFGSISERAAKQSIVTTIAIIGSSEDFAATRAARERLLPAFGEDGLPEIIHESDQGNIEQKVSQLLAAPNKKIVAVLTGGLAEPVLTGSIPPQTIVHKQIETILAEARHNKASVRGGTPLAGREVLVVRAEGSTGAIAMVRGLTARVGQLLLFMLTVLLAGMLLSNLIEEKSNKVIEVLAAAVPVDGIFIGKIFAMLAVSLVGIAVWGSGGAIALSLLPGDVGGLPDPAVGWPIFVTLMLLYFAANYLLLGALFLGIGSQASSVREIQILSMPVTVGQMLIFLFASAGVGASNSSLGIAAAIFPFSSPLAMVARAAQSAELWPHLLALGWQALWVWLTVSLSASLFRRNVLKSGRGAGFRLRRRGQKSS